MMLFYPCSKVSLYAITFKNYKLINKKPLKLLDTCIFRTRLANFKEYELTFTSHILCLQSAGNIIVIPFYCIVILLFERTYLYRIIN